MATAVVLGIGRLRADQQAGIVAKAQAKDPENPNKFPKLEMEGTSLMDSTAQWASEILPGT
eukprot:3066178-Alexandrium_andersonii.AAC.1